MWLLQDTAQDAVSGGRPGSAARSRSAGGRARSGGHQADSRMSPATDEENSNIMLLLDAAEELHKTASHDGPEPSTAATHGMLHQGMNASHAGVMGALIPSCFNQTLNSP